MEYFNIIIFILIFIILLAVFYIVVSNLGTVSSSYDTNNNTDPKFNTNKNQEIEKKVSMLNHELSNIKNTLGISVNPSSNINVVPFPEKSNILKDNSVKEIIIESDDPVVNLREIGNVLSDNLSNTSNTSNTYNTSCPDNVCTKPPPIIFDPIANYDIAKLTDPLVDPRGRTSADQIPTPQVAAQFNFPTQGVLDRYHRVGLLIAIGSNVKNENIEKTERTNKFGLPYVESSDSSNSSDSSDTEFVWEGNNKMGISKGKKSKKSKGKKYIQTDNEYSSGTTTVKTYKGVDIKENFDSDSDLDSLEYFGNTDKSVTNIYNVYSNQNDNNILELIGKKITDNWYKYFTSITMGNKVIKVVVKNRNRKELYSGDIVFIPEIGKTYRVKIDPMDMIEYNPYMF